MPALRAPRSRPRALIGRAGARRPIARPRAFTYSPAVRFAPLLRDTVKKKKKKKGEKIGSPVARSRRCCGDPGRESTLRHVMQSDISDLFLTRFVRISIGSSIRNRAHANAENQDFGSRNIHYNRSKITGCLLEIL